MRQSSFDRQRERGELGERLVARWAQSLGYGVICSCDFSGRDDSKAPRLMFDGGGLVVPDLDICRAGRRVWVEVKTYRAPAYNKTHNCMVHGIRQRHHADYLRVAEQTGCSVVLMVLEVESGRLLSMPLGTVDGWPCQCGPCRSGTGGCLAAHKGGPKNGIYWPTSAFKTANTFGAQEMDPIRTAFSCEAA